MKLKHFILLAFVLNCFNVAKAQEQVKTTDQVLKEAYKAASVDNKKVLLMFHASWCVWCRKMDSSINDMACKKMFLTNYVICHLTVDESKENKMLENPGADAFRAKYHGETAGLPFWLILDKDGKLLADSRMRKPGDTLDAPGDNTGCPTSKNEVAYFLSVLKTTSNLKDPQLKIIGERFSKNQ
jgi:hypothetical protein